VSSLSTDCARAREFVSAQLDDELAETELDRLETHLRFCPACSAWAEEVRDITLRLRGASLEQPAERLALPGRTRRWAVSGSVALGSVAALVATMFFAPGQHGSVVPHRASAPRLAGAKEQRPAAPRGWLEDGLYSPVAINSGPTASQVRFRPV
jgi:anti-sigma factor RsiW